MNAKRGTAALIGLALVAVVTLGPWYLGQRAEQAYRDQLAALERQPKGWRVVTEDYRRGWFSSQASAELAPTQEGLADALRLRIDSHLTHGPQGLSDLTWPPTLTRADSLLALDHPMVQLSGVRAQTRIGWDGDALSRIELPAMDQPADDNRLGLRIAAGQGELHVGRAGPIAARIELPALELLDAQGHAFLALRGLKAANEITPWLPGLGIGSGDLSIAEAAVQAPDLEIDARDLHIAIGSHQDAGLLEILISYSVATLRIDGADYAPSQIDISLNRLGGEALSAVQTDLAEIAAQDQPEAMAGIARLAVLMRHLPELAVTNPSIAIKHLDIATPEGQVSGHLTLGVQGLTATDLLSKGAWIQRLTGDGELSLPRRVALKLATRAILQKAQGASDHQDRPPLTADQEQAAADAATAQLDGLLSSGWIGAEGDRIKTTLMLADGLLTINGKTLPIGITGAQ